MSTPNGDGEKLSSHIVEVVQAAADNPGALTDEVEAAYQRLSDRAEKDRSLIVGVVQAVSTYALDGERAYVLVVLTAQRISREDFERQQRMAQFGAGPRR